MHPSSCVIGILSLCLAAVTATAQETVFVSKAPSGRQVFTNRPLSQDSRPLIDVRDAGPSGAFNEQPRINPDGEQEASAAINALIETEASRLSLDPHLIHAIVTVESAFNRTAVSPKGARGLMQLMPNTGRRFGLVDPFDPRDNIAAGSAYLKHLLSLFKGDLKLALAAYNAGEAAVMKYNWNIPPYLETQNYVAKVLRLYRDRRKGISE